MKLSDFENILQKFGIIPSNLSFYKTAFTHRSYLNESKDAKESNERMEFLGDAILSYVISSFLYKKRPFDNEGNLTNTRAYLVKTESLAKVSENLSFGKFLKMSRGEESSGGRSNPQLLANTYEAVLGAIYLDLGIEKAEQFISRTILPNFEDVIQSGPPPDPKSLLQEVVQSQFQASPRYKILATSGPDHAKKFIVGVFIDGKKLGEGKGSSKQQAEENAAKAALAGLALSKKPH